LPVWPLLIILDGAADETLTKFCGDQEVSLVSLDRTHGRSVVISKDRDVLEGFAQRFLNTKQPRPRVRARRPALPDRETGGTR
jgi:hypothetical protein